MGNLCSFPGALNIFGRKNKTKKYFWTLETCRALYEAHNDIIVVQVNTRMSRNPTDFKAERS